MAKSTKGAKRIKAAAALWVPGTREEVIEESDYSVTHNVNWSGLKQK